MNGSWTLNPQFGFDFTSKDALENSIKAKKITVNEIKYIINNINNVNKNEDNFILQILLEIFNDKLLDLETSVAKMHSREFEVKNNIANSLADLNSKKIEIIKQFKKCNSCRKKVETKKQELEVKIVDIKQELNNDFWNRKRSNQEKLKYSLTKLNNEYSLIEKWLDSNHICDEHIMNIEKLENIENEINNLEMKLKIIKS